MSILDRECNAEFGVFGGCQEKQRHEKMNKNEIGKKIHEAHGGLSYIEARKIINFILETMKNRLSRGEKVLLSGFGCFYVTRRKARRGVNPQTGAPVIITGRNSVKFKPSKYLKTV